MKISFTSVNISLQRKCNNTRVVWSKCDSFDKHRRIKGHIKHFQEATDNESSPKSRSCFGSTFRQSCV